MKYRVKEPFLAVRRSADGQSQFVRLETGNVFTIRSEPHAGLVNVLYKGRQVVVFVEDIQRRAVKVWEARAGE